MYFAMIILLMVLFPLASIAADYSQGGAGSDVAFMTVKWFLFWAVGARLLLAGLRQIFSPAFTAQEIFKINDSAAFLVVRELGYWNAIIGGLSLLSLWRPDWIVPLAIAGCLYFGLAGATHIFEHERGAKENAAMVSDLWVAAVLAWALISL